MSHISCGGLFCLTALSILVEKWRVGMNSISFILHRKASMIGALLPDSIQINGQCVGTLLCGGTLTAEVPQADVYYIEDCPFSGENAVLLGSGQRQYRILLKKAGGWKTICHSEFYIDQDSMLIKAPSLCFDELYRAVFENKLDTLSAEEQVLALCLEFVYAISDGFQEVHAFSNIFRMMDALRKVGAVQYADLLQRLITITVPGVPLPLNDDEIELIQNRLEKADREIWKQKTAYEELHRAFVSYLTANFDRLAHIFRKSN